MSKEEYVHQHIVPKRYLDRFASRNGDKYIIGTCYYNNNKLRFFPESTENVGYINNFYDVTDKDDPKYWEHFFAEKIDTLCGTEMENIISSAILSQNNTVVLSEHNKEVLSKIIVAQMMRVPSSIDYMKNIVERTEKKLFDNMLPVIPDSLLKECKHIVQLMTSDTQWQKEIFFNHSFEPENFQKYCQLLQERIWVVYVNSLRCQMPFTTSDNPVLVESVAKKTLGFFKNGLADPSTCIFYPLSPTIAVANYCRNGIMEKYDGETLLLDDLKFILDRNNKIIQQAYQHSFFPQPLFEKVKCASKNNHPKKKNKKR